MNNMNKSFEELWKEVSSKREVVELQEYNEKNDKVQKLVQINCFCQNMTKYDKRKCYYVHGRLKKAIKIRGLYKHI